MGIKQIPNPAICVLAQEISHLFTFPVYELCIKLVLFPHPDSQGSPQKKQPKASRVIAHSKKPSKFDNQSEYTVLSDCGRIVYNRVLCKLTRGAYLLVGVLMRFVVRLGVGAGPVTQ